MVENYWQNWVWAVIPEKGADVFLWILYDHWLCLGDYMNVADAEQNPIAQERGGGRGKSIGGRKPEVRRLASIS